MDGAPSFPPSLRGRDREGAPHPSPAERGREQTELIARANSINTKFAVTRPARPTSGYGDCHRTTDGGNGPETTVVATNDLPPTATLPVFRFEPFRYRPEVL